MTFSHRLTRHSLILLLVLAALLLSTPTRATATADCRVFRTTGYVRTELSAFTADGTSIYTDEPIVAASWDVPMGALVEIDGLGTFRVADRGMLGSSGWLDIAVWSRSEAFSLTGYRQACVFLPGEMS